ncbi:MAG: hypothetical protein JRC86_13255 [Deltaproteobacteria bacterium]|nr:hypothetical protein [Deltaproteobacteria bacterium]
MTEIVDLAAEVEEECPVCLISDEERMTNEISVLNCGHKICEKCAFTLFRSNRMECPLCRGDVFSMENCDKIVLFEKFGNTVRSRIEFKNFNDYVSE